MDAEGVFYQQPNASDRRAAAAARRSRCSTLPSTRTSSRAPSWTLNGKFGALKAVYTGGYLVRNVEQVGDYTNYARGVYADYYQCYGPGRYTPYLPSKCFSPSATWRSAEQNTHQQHELRLQHARTSGACARIGRRLPEDNKLYDQTGWKYKTVPACTVQRRRRTDDPGNTGCFTPIGTSRGRTSCNPGVQGANTSFYQDTCARPSRRPSSPRWTST